MKKRFILTALTTLAMVASANAAIAEGDCHKGSYGAGITVAYDATSGKCVATIDGDDKTVLNLPDASFSVDAVIYSRKNVVSKKPQTFVPPFSVQNCSWTNVDEFGTLDRIYVNNEGLWKSEVVRVQTSFDANKPYILQYGSTVTEDGVKVGRIGFGGDGCSITFEKPNSAPMTEFASSAKDKSGLIGTWQFIGVYELKSWTEDDVASNEIGPDGVTYGFAAKESNGTYIGQFVKATCKDGSCASVPPLRAYLKFVPSPSAQGKPQYSALAKESAVALPDEIEVEFASLLSAEDGASSSVSFPEGECFKDSITDGEITPGYKSIEFKTFNGKKTACIDGFSRARFQTVNIPQDVEVDTVIFNRRFPKQEGSVQQFSTIMLPFSTVGNRLENARIFKLSKIGRDCDYSTCPWKVYADYTDSLYANTPYLIAALEDAIAFKITWWNNDKGKNETTVSLKSTSTSNASAIDDDWEFRGSYEHVIWNSSSLARVYGLAALGNKAGITPGTFVKAATGASVSPMRAYLYYKGASNQSASRSLLKTAPETLPDSIEIVVRDADGKVMSIGQLNTVTGEVNMNKDLWFDLKGRQFNKKPTIKGTYYNQGRKVIIK